ncbi:hypothetical protein [Paraburkholderia phytofirmans]|uniref:hypothetical protein n=1 Tax=Paraburkholderia phytofirmans TaxID=261302 RepID=UPI0011D0F24B|nr:hypothetical protein [Paraburkholderia phytofirmans]
MIIASGNRGNPLNGLSVMVTEWIAIVNLKNKLLSRNRMYEENRYLAFDMRTKGQRRATVTNTEAISACCRRVATRKAFQASMGGVLACRIAFRL